MKGLRPSVAGFISCCCPCLPMCMLGIGIIRVLTRLNVYGMVSSRGLGFPGLRGLWVSGEFDVLSRGF